MNAQSLYQLGRWLTKIGEESMQPAGAPVTAPGVRLILMDVFASPDSSIGEIAARTGLPQSYVSESVAGMREKGAFETRVDPSDGRRTLVRVSDAIPKVIARIGAVSVDAALAEALGDADAATTVGLIAALEEVATRLRVTRGGPGSVADRLAAAQGGQR
jgi:DNA-binding MarR family transcriptional regulator